MYVHYFNLLNKECTATTCVEMWRACKETAIGLARTRKQMGWEFPKLSQAMICKLSYTYVDAVHPGWWSTWQAYEVCTSFFTQGKKMEVLLSINGAAREAGACNVFDDVAKLFEKHVDWDHPAAQDTNGIFHRAKTVFATLK